MAIDLQYLCVPHEHSELTLQYGNCFRVGIFDRCKGWSAKSEGKEELPNVGVFIQTIISSDTKII